MTAQQRDPGHDDIILTLALLACVGCDREAIAPETIARAPDMPLFALVGPVTQVDAGGAHTCAIGADASLVCWGHNSFGQAEVPPGLGPVTQVSAGPLHTCAIKSSDGSVACWGDDEYRQPIVPWGLAPASQVSAGFVHTCAVKSGDGSVVCWGGESDDDTPPTVPAGLGPVTQVSAGFSHACAVKSSDGSLVCWGDGMAANVPASLGAVAQVSTGTTHTCAVKSSDGTLACWGYNAWRQTDVPASLGVVAQVSAGAIHTCAVKSSDGTVACWGYNASGQADAPADLGPVTQVSAGGEHTCAVKTGGGVACWGHPTATSNIPPASQNAQPVVTSIALPQSPLAVGATATVSASFDDDNSLDTHTATIDWGTVTKAATVDQLTKTVSGSHTYTQAGIYTVEVTVDDNDLAGRRSSALDDPAHIVVYDPNAGSVTDGGWIDSPPGACSLFCAGVTGKVSFGFASRYHSGATVPSGNTEFQVNAGSLRFKSLSYEWLVVAGSRAQYRGTGTINGSGDYGFLVTAIDGQIAGGGGVDRFRIKIWDRTLAVTDTGYLVYDNELGADETSPAATALGGGSIVIHAKK